MSEKLFDCILAKINFTDKDNSANFSKRNNLCKFFLVLSDKIKITKPYYISSNDPSDKIKLKSLTGNEVVKILNYFTENRLNRLFPEVDFGSANFV